MLPDWLLLLWWQIFPPPMIWIRVVCHGYHDGENEIQIRIMRLNVRGPFSSTLERIVQQGGIITPHQFVPLAKVFTVEEIDGQAL